jgi:RNA polymerase sigma factor (sigma-70 family)
MVDDLELLDAWAAGDRDAAAVLLERYLDPVARFFRGKVTGDVEDFAQEAFTRCLARRRGLAPGSSFRAYLFAVARNLLYEHHRKAPRLAALDPEQVSLVELATSPSIVLHRSREQRLMMAALRAIPLDSQLAIELFYWEELSSAEMASVLEIPIGTVKSRLHRARAQLKRQLELIGRDDPALDVTLTQVAEWERSATGES